MKRFVRPPPGSRSRRFDHHDYRGGAYFITTNTAKRIPLFGSVERGRMYLNALGKIVAEEWDRTGALRDEVSLDAFIVMPDHVHGILWINSDADPKLERTREARLANTSLESHPGLEIPKRSTLSTIIGAFKSAATRRINRKRDTAGATVWQASFHDHIARNRTELQRTRHYIRTNPKRKH